MANMSYCRFNNTLDDLRDCAEHIQDNDLSYEERKRRLQLVKICRQIVEDYEAADMAADDE